MTAIPWNGSAITASDNHTTLEREFIKSNGLDCNLDYTECDAARYLWIVLIPPLLVLGTCGNFMVFIIMRTKVLRRTAFGCYLAAIAVTDTIGIWSALVRYFTTNLFQYDFRGYHAAVCCIHNLLQYGSIDTSVWLLVAVCLERTLSIYAPTKAQLFKSLGRTKIIILLIALFQYGWNFQVFFTRGIDYRSVNGSSLGKQCGYRFKASEEYYKNVHIYIVMLDYSLIPFIAMLVMNILIILRLKERDRLYEDCTAQNKYKREDKSKLYNSRVSNKTRMLLPVTFFFLATTLPSLAYTGAERAIQPVGHLKARMVLISFFTTTLQYLNHSSSFFLYCVSGATFRRVCWAFLRSCLCHQSSQTEQTACETQFDRYPGVRRGCAQIINNIPEVPENDTHETRKSNILIATELFDLSSISFESNNSKSNPFLLPS